MGVKKLAALILLGSALSLGAQDKPRRFVETGFDAGGSFANSYLRTGDIFKEKITLDTSQMAGELGNGLAVMFDAHGEAFINFNLGALWGIGFFVGMDSLGQFRIPQSMVELLTEGNDPDKSYSDNLSIGAAAFLETGFWASAKIRRIKFTIRPAYFLPLAYLSKPRANYAFAIKDDGSVTVAGNYRVEVYTPLPLNEIEDFDDIGSLPGKIDVWDMFGKGGVDMVLRAEYPVYHNFTVGASLGHIPLAPARLTEKYSLSGDFEITKTLEDIINNDFDLPDIDPVSEFDEDHKMVFRPFKIGVDAVYRPFNIRLLTLRPEAALVFNSVYDTPVYLDFGAAAELNLGDIFMLSAGTHLEDLVWKERAGLTLNFRIVEISAGITTQSQQFLRSFQGAGFAVDVGVRLGF
ncbi:MAG: hypothetical protein LBK63_12205 [Treponema sp.]|jgi:hypothetical protein|nr:hypothetical protein [Treponema sp.]